MKRTSAFAGLFVTFSLIFAAPVMAAAPTNDTYAGRTVIGAIPFTDSVDTTEATTDADDAALNEQCGAPATDASVWYEFTSAEDVSLLADVSASDYSAGVLIAVGSPGSFSVISCGPGGAAWFAAAGETYTLLIFDDQLDGTGNGGMLELFIDLVPPPPEISITVDPAGTFDPSTGSATISGTVNCSADADFAFIDVSLEQRVGRFIIRGFGGTEVFCDGTTQPWSVEVFGDTGQFKGGQTVAVTFGVACGIFDCGFDEQVTTVRLRR